MGWAAKNTGKHWIILTYKLQKTWTKSVWRRCLRRALWTSELGSLVSSLDSNFEEKNSLKVIEQFVIRITGYTVRKCKLSFRKYIFCL